MMMQVVFTKVFFWDGTLRMVSSTLIAVESGEEKRRETGISNFKFLVSRSPARRPSRGVSKGTYVYIQYCTVRVHSKYVYVYVAQSGSIIDLQFLKSVNYTTMSNQKISVRIENTKHNILNTPIEEERIRFVCNKTRNYYFHKQK